MCLCAFVCVGGVVVVEGGVANVRVCVCAVRECAHCVCTCARVRVCVCVSVCAFVWVGVIGHLWRVRVCLVHTSSPVQNIDFIFSP